MLDLVCLLSNLMKKRLSLSILSSAVLANPSPAFSAVTSGDPYIDVCEPITETRYINERLVRVQEKCRFSKDIIESCKSIDKDSIFYQCNVFDQKINSSQIRKDDNGIEYTTVLFKYSEGTQCDGGGSDFMFLSRCDTFASYVQFIRNNETDKCHVFVSSALLGRQKIDQGRRNTPAKIVKRVRIPGIQSAVVFKRSNGSEFVSQDNSKFLLTKNSSTKAIQPGPAVGPLHVLELTSSLLTKESNLKPNPAKVRIDRGKGGAGDSFDIPLGRREEEALNKVLSKCK